MATATPWDSVAEDHRSYLQEAGITKDEFNGLTIRDRISKERVRQPSEGAAAAR